VGSVQDRRNSGATRVEQGARRVESYNGNGFAVLFVFNANLTAWYHPCAGYRRHPVEK